MTNRQKKKRRIVRLLKTAGAIGLAALGLMAAGLAHLYAEYGREPAARFVSTGPNAAWVGHRWVQVPLGSSDYSALARQFAQHRITDAFFHVGPLDGRGRIPAGRYAHATTLLRSLKARMPELRIQAWMGQVARQAGGPLDLSNATVRAEIVRTASRFLDLGFDGVHLNIEPLPSGDPDFLSLLDAALRLTRSKAKLLSVATDELEPAPGLAWLTGRLPIRGGFWSEGYYRAVAARVDQIAVMMYDTTLPTDWLYGSLVAWETRRIVELIGDGATLFMGVPTYEDRRFSFRPEAENICSALRGVQHGLAAGKAGPPAGFGLAIYANWTTEPAEWAVYRREWLGLADTDAARPCADDIARRNTG
jgi:hypothetical protein